MRGYLIAMLLVGCGPKQPAAVPAPPGVVQPDPEVTVPEKGPEPVKHPWPSSRVATQSDSINGKTIADPFRWLEDEKSPEVQAWMTAQDAFARTELAKFPGRAAIADRMKQLLYYDSISAPTNRKGRLFYSRKHADKEKSVVYWKQGETGAEKVLLDPNTWSADGSKGLHGTLTSLEGKYVAYQVSEHNSDETVTHVIEVATGKELPDVIPGTRYGVHAWNPASTGFYYTWIPPIGDKVTVAARPGFAEVRFHKLGTDPATDEVVHAATGNAETFIAGGITEDGHWITVSIQHGWNSSDLYVKDARNPKSTFEKIVADDGATYATEYWKDQFYLLTNKDAPNYRIQRVDAKTKKWTEIVKAGETPIESHAIVGGKLVLASLKNATTELAIHTLDGKLERKVTLPGIGSASNVFGNPDEDTGYFSYTSFTDPQIIEKISIKTGKTEEWSRVKIPIDTTPFTTDQVFYPSKDGTKVSMFIIHRKDVKLDGTNPTILYGYGGFNVNMTPGFSGSRVVWLENGGVYAMPNLRGGGEYGEDWHKSGMLGNKQNVFDDFIAAGEWLIANKWTSKEHLAVSGGSNGGLLTGAVLAQRPDLFKAVICAVPLLDMLRFHMFGSGKTWVPEYGDPEDKTAFEWLYKYSPYRVAVDAGKVKYPAVLFDSSDHDDRVDPMHARKLAAVLQSSTTGDAPILLRIERNAGHGGADDVKSAVERVADQLSFLKAELK